MKKYFEFMAKYYPDGDKDSSFNSYGYSTLAADDSCASRSAATPWTRENVMKQATSLKDVQLDSLAGRASFAKHVGRPIIAFNKQFADDAVGQRRAVGKCFGPILEDAGPAG